MKHRIRSWFNGQPVGVRAALILAAATCVVGVLSFSKDLLLHDQQAPKHRKANSDVVADPCERGVILVDLGYTLYVVGLVASAMPEELDTPRAKREVTDLYRRLGLQIPETGLGKETMEATKEALPIDRERVFFDLGAGVAAVSSIGVVMLTHRGTAMEDEARSQMPAIISKLELQLQAVGFLDIVQQEGPLRETLVPKSTESEDAYFQRLGSLKATIKAAIRQNCGSP